LHLFRGATVEQVSVQGPADVWPWVQAQLERDAALQAKTLLSIITIALCAVVCGASSWNEMAEFGQGREEWFARFLPLPHGIPSHDTCNRVCAALDSGQFRTCFSQGMAAVAGVLPTQVIALDGKTLRGIHGEAVPGVHLVAAYAPGRGTVAAQKGDRIKTLN